jgi:DNA-binding NarL/FixJ family response regulator
MTQDNPAGKERTIRLVLIEDQRLLADCLATWLVEKAPFALLGRASNGESALRLCEENLPDIAVVDVELPDWDGLKLGRELVRRHPGLRVISISVRTDPYMIWRVRGSGLHGFVDNGQGPGLLREAILAVASGKSFFSDVVDDVRRRWLSQPEAFCKVLTNRQLEILRYVSVGFSDEKIAEALNISTATVGTHRKNIRQKLEAHTDRDLVAYARFWGLADRRQPSLGNLP